MKLPAEATIYEVGPRDGLQNEARPVPTAEKIRFIDALVASGIRNIEITSFVSAKWIPQLADSAEVARGVHRPPGVRMSALVPNKRGLETALAAGMKEIALFISVSETHNKKNVNKTIAETLTVFEEVVKGASAAGIAAGRSAGCLVVACRAGNFAGWDQSGAHRVIDTLDELTPALVGELDAHYGSGMVAP